LAGFCPTFAQAEGPLRGALPTLQMLTPSIPNGSIARTRRDDLNDRDVSEGSGHAPAFTAPNVAEAAVRRVGHERL
jgi:hypothetical protein